MQVPKAGRQAAAATKNQTRHSWLETISIKCSFILLSSSGAGFAINSVSGGGRVCMCMFLFYQQYQETRRMHTRNTCSCFNFFDCLCIQWTGHTGHYSEKKEARKQCNCTTYTYSGGITIPSTITTTSIPIWSLNESIPILYYDMFALLCIILIHKRQRNPHSWRNPRRRMNCSSPTIHTHIPCRTTMPADSQRIPWLGSARFVF